MDLDDLLEDLLDGVRHRMRAEVRQARQELTSRAGRRGAAVRRGARRVARAGGLVIAVVFAVLTAALALAGDPGGLRLLGAALAALIAAGGGGIALAAHRAERRDPRSRASRSRRRRTARRRAGRRGNRSAQPAPDPAVEELRTIPQDVRGDWDRLLQARRLLQDLATDGWVDRSSLLEVDGLVVRLHRLLVVDARTSDLGGTASPGLRQQVADLADLLVALADDAVQLQVSDTSPRDAVQATLTDARDHLTALRAARQEVQQIDQQPRPAEG